jgi:YXWGXW repeat-containing protein
MRKLFLLGCLPLVFGMLAFSSLALAQVSIGVSVRIGPPALPVYEQPPCPGDGFIWTPGYWAWGPDGYFWVPGTWVIAPRVGFLWTPGYWGWGGGVYIWHPGYWGPHIGFYGGINYGFGYTGVGYAGGYWRGGNFVYNRSVTNVNVTVVHNTYNQTVVNNNVTVNRVSYNGGTGGVTARPSQTEQAAVREQHIAPTGEQTQHEHVSGSNRALLASANHGQPPIAATPKAGVFSGRDVVAARGATPNARGAERPVNAAPNARSEGRPSPRGETPGATPRSNTERPAERPAARPAERPQPERPAERPAQRPAERPQPQQPRARPNNAPEPRANTAPKPSNRPEPREKGGNGEERR